MTHKRPRKGLRKKEIYVIIKEIATKKLKVQKYSNYLTMNNHNYRKIIYEMSNRTLEIEKQYDIMTWFYD